MATKKTRKDDAASIVGTDLADEIEAKSKVSTQRSDILIEMSDAEDKTEAEAPAETTEVTVETTVSDGGEVSKSVVTEKFDDPTMQKVTDEPSTYVGNLPYGGATTMRDAEKYVEAKNEAIYLMDMWSVFSNVMWNIIERNDVPNKRTAMNTAVDEFKNILTAKAMLAFSQAASVELSKTEVHELQPAIDVLLKTVDNSLTLMSDQDKGNLINPALQEFAQAISGFITQKPVEPPAPDNDNETLLKDIQKLIQPIAEELSTIKNQVGVLEAKSSAQAVVPPSRIPQPRTLSASLVAKAEPQAKPGSIKDIARKSVGLNQ